MTANRFAALCNKYGIDPALALESDSIQVALRNKDTAEVERILKEEF